MGLLSSLASVFGGHIDADKKEKIRNEIDLAEAVQAHVRWKLRLQDYLDGKSSEKLDPMVICRDDQCDLGKWIHSSGMGYFHDLEPFHQLRSDHAQFHYVAANVVQHVHANDRAAAEAALHGEYQQVSHKVVVALTELNKAVAD